MYNPRSYFHVAPQSLRGCSLLVLDKEGLAVLQAESACASWNVDVLRVLLLARATVASVRSSNSVLAFGDDVPRHNDSLLVLIVVVGRA